MKKSTKNKMLMYQMVSDIINDYPSAWSGIPKFATTFTTFSAKFESLKVLAEKERAYVVGVKDSRDSLREETAENAIQISSALVALAAETKDIELLSLMRITKVQLLNRSHADTVILLDRILIHAQQYSIELVEYGVTQELLNKMILLRDELVVKILSPRKAILKRKDTIVQIATLSSEIDLLLKNSLDKMVNVLRTDNIQFYNEYFNSRMVLSYGNNSGSINNTNG
jgi:hypothetical protein